ncbi:hypothetical protein BY996DRAFT_6606306 [Phakopsora pachyrhizi]|nr:hypothetical protein BY996DRAFT_6606306 [Phakopsora pachyrhizi]
MVAMNDELFEEADEHKLLDVLMERSDCSFQRSYRDASNRGLERKDQMKKVADKFEHGLEILGATALKDKLQTTIGDWLHLQPAEEHGAQSQIKQGLEKLMTYSSFMTLSAEIGAEDFERRSRINDLSMNNSTKDSGLGIAGEKSTGEDRPLQQQQWERGIWEQIKTTCKPWVKLDKTTGGRNTRFLGFETPIVYNDGLEADLMDAACWWELGRMMELWTLENEDENLEETF